MKVARQLTLWLLPLLLAACSTSQSVCRGPLHPINVHAAPVPGWSP